MNATISKRSVLRAAPMAALTLAIALLAATSAGAPALLAALPFALIALSLVSGRFTGVETALELAARRRPQLRTRAQRAHTRPREPFAPAPLARLAGARSLRAPPLAA